MSFLWIIFFRSYTLLPIRTFRSKFLQANWTFTSNKQSRCRQNMFDIWTTIFGISTFGILITVFDTLMVGILFFALFTHSQRLVEVLWRITFDSLFCTLIILTQIKGVINSLVYLSYIGSRFPPTYSSLMGFRSCNSSFWHSIKFWHSLLFHLSSFMMRSLLWILLFGMSLWRH